MSENGFRRNNFFSGRLLTAADLQLEQTYFREKQRLHNRALHGFGIVSGLDISRCRDRLLITTGLAIDCEGNEILVPENQSQPLPQLSPDTSVFLIINYCETAINLTLATSADKSSEPALIQEGYSLAFENSNPNQSHRHLRGRWQSCGMPHGLALARLRMTSGKWQLDRRLRRPEVK